MSDMTQQQVKVWVAQELKSTKAGGAAAKKARIEALRERMKMPAFAGLENSYKAQQQLLAALLK